MNSVFDLFIFALFDRKDMYLVMISWIMSKRTFLILNQISGCIIEGENKNKNKGNSNKGAPVHVCGRIDNRFRFRF